MRKSPIWSNGRTCLYMFFSHCNYHTSNSMARFFFCFFLSWMEIEKIVSSHWQLQITWIVISNTIHNWNAKVRGRQSEGYVCLWVTMNREGPLDYANNWTPKMFSIPYLSHDPISSWHMSFMVSILTFNCCQIPLKHKNVLFKKIDFLMSSMLEYKCTTVWSITTTLCVYNPW